ncbi:alpha/beta fold hydrolase [Aquisalinus flavus]|uniref:Alpha/beta hydrolase n=1 Tax=Aquisalinus flavus TaxID=1526572 RepID=A0A8J2Y4J5_9PROT|nr:alpha/beta hydrolase [Aquisalinus flavus]MBD0426740.1 alpha/beta hydrolase [Aquisalinus flavus]UNE46600.1 alpha/beta hydrolase [Aquisalinus flavus]GGC95601.1 alpha/beta hydrolase [Aquisalinus flavus]
MKQGKMNAGVVTALVVAIVTALWVAGVWAAEPQPEPEVKRVSVQTSGDGEAVYFLPGLMSPPDVFDDAITAVEDIEANRVSFAGMAGALPMAEPSPYIAPAVAALAGEISARDAGPVKLVGHSMGGLMALLVAAGHPDLVDSVLVVDAVPFLPGLFQPGISADAAAQQGAMMAMQMHNATPEQFAGFVAAGLTRQAAGEADRQMILEAAKASDQASAAAATGEMLATDYSAQLAGLSVPVTVLVPHHAGIGVSEEALLGVYEAQYTGLENVTFIVVPDSRHFIMLDQPEAFAAALQNFVEGE